MVRKLFYWICWICIEANGQQFSNNITQYHSRVENSNIYIIVPKGFIWINRSLEYVNPAIKASISINRIESLVDVVHEQMSKENSIAQGIIVKSERPIKLGNYKGYLFETTRTTNKEKFASRLLIFGVEKETYGIQFIFAEKNNTVSELADKTLAGVAFKEFITKAKLRFMMDFNKFNFELTESDGNSSIYKSTKDNLMLTVNQFYTRKGEDVQMIFFNKMQQLPYSSVSLDDNGIEEITINNLPGLQATINGSDEKSMPVYIYQLLISQDQTQYLLTGKSSSITELDQFKELAKTFRLLP